MWNTCLKDPTRQICGVTRAAVIIMQKSSLILKLPYFEDAITNIISNP